MGSQVKWTERFGFSEPPAGEGNALFAALVQGRLSEHEYFAWAQDTYQLPLVTPDFFTIPADTHFWERVKDVHAWSPDFFPLADWDGVLLIACVEPPANFRLNQPHRFLLATARNLQMHWRALNPEPVRQVGHSAPGQAGAAPVMPAVTPLVSEPILDTGTVVGDLVDLSNDLPDGVLPNFALNGIAEGAAQPVVPPPPVFDPVMDMPEGIANMQMHEDLAPVPATPEGFSEPVAAAMSPVKIGFGMKSPPRPEKAPPIAAAPEPMPQPVAVSAPPPPIAAEPIAIEPASAITEMTGSSFTMTMTMTNSPDPNWILPTDPIALDRCGSLDELNLHTLSTICRHFTGGIILLKDASGAMKPGRFTQPFRTPKKEFGAIQFDEPSIFRIVNRTLLPYHGYVTPAPENNRFFKAFLGGMAPAHITIVPVLQNKELVGMLIGIADAEKSFRHILPLMESLAGQFAKAYARLAPQSAAA